VVGFGAACALARQEMDQRNTRWRRQRDRLEAAAQALGAQIIGRQTPRVANTLCVVFPDQEGETLVQALDLQGVAASHGAACASGSLEPSPVLTAMGVSHVRGALRLSLGPRTTDEEIERAIQALAACLTPSP